MDYEKYMVYVIIKKSVEYVLGVSKNRSKKKREGENNVYIRRDKRF